jgi:hypothetical protein
MLQNRTFKIVWVGQNHGIGLETEKNPDKIIKYKGKQIVVKK